MIRYTLISGLQTSTVFAELYISEKSLSRSTVGFLNFYSLYEKQQSKSY